MVCIFVCMYVCMYVRAYVRTYVRMYVCMYVNEQMKEGRNEWMNKCMYVCIYLCMNVCMYVCMYAYTYTYIYISYTYNIYICVCVKTKTKRPEGTYPWIRLPTGCPYRPARVMLQAPSPAGPSRDQVVGTRWNQTGWRGLIPVGMYRNSFWLGCWIWGWLGNVFSQQCVWLWEITHDLQPNCWLKTSNHVQMSTKQWTKRCTASKLTAYDASAEGGGGPPTFQWWCWGMGEKAMRESFEKERAILARCENGDCLMHIVVPGK